ncbi:EVE domain-containing protein [Aureimonas fodinaquatilis]|uniref:EVE domain-containing protein n=1 Tax=Aureimonas fodinaquatilis TaxID=2565783 RepID=A0A5B0DTB1_9HYPH|nr:EVE domain-containing protein [Aureimonas fodinaquatilis]KAA0969676.1 EVE domain-containing protein [Aureimonas fodinaquatilis]
MAFWLFKSEPFKWSFEHQKQVGDAGQQWDGVRNYQARNFMREMKPGERGFFYHSNEGKEVVGIVEVTATAHHDTTSDDPRWECVDVKAVMDMPMPVTLEAIKAEPRLSEMVLVTNSRLSVQPVQMSEFKLICEMGGLDPKKAMG